MKTIYQNTEVAYHAITIRDAITMLPTMNMLICDYKNNLDKFNNADEDDKEIYYYRLKSLHQQLQILFNLGFITSNNNDDLLSLPKYKEEK